MEKLRPEDFKNPIYVLTINLIDVLKKGDQSPAVTAITQQLEFELLLSRRRKEKRSTG